MSTDREEEEGVKTECGCDDKKIDLCCDEQQQQNICEMGCEDAVCCVENDVST
jgi:hypothetical protein